MLESHIIAFMALFAGLTAVESDMSSPHIGRGFFLPDNSAYRLSVEGKTIFEQIPDTCFKKHDNLGRNKAQFYAFETPDTFYQFLGEQLGLKNYEILPHNFYETLVDVSESINLKLNIVGAGIEITREISSYQVDPDCLTRVPLNEQLLQDFDELEEVIANPALPSGWKGYDTFLKKYGTHYIKSAMYGNRVMNFVFAKSILGYSADQIHAATCAKLRNAKFTFCSQFNDTDYALAEELETAMFYEVRGGSVETRVKMTVGEPTPTEIYEFMESNTDDEQHIRVTIEPLIEFLKRRFLGSARFVKTLNMQQYYEGFLSRGCYEQHINGVLAKRFTLISTASDIPEYKCELARTGCRSNKDCYLSASTMWTTCYCYGETCITSEEISVPGYGTQETRAALLSKRGSAFEGENMSCHYKFGPRCECDRFAAEQWDQVWPGPDSHFTQNLRLYRDMHLNMAKLGTSDGSGTKTNLLAIIMPLIFGWILY